MHALLINLLSNDPRPLISSSAPRPAAGSTLVCHALGETGVAGRPEEYFEALRHSGRPRRPEEYFLGVEDQSIRDHLGERGVGAEQTPRSPLWSRAAYDRYLEWAFEAGTTPNGVFGAKLMWGYFGDFVSLVRNVPAYRDLPLAELLPDRLPRTSPSSASSAPTRCARRSRCGRPCRRRPGARTRRAPARSRSRTRAPPPYRTFIEEHRPQLRFHYRAINHLLEQLLIEEASWDAFFEHSGIKPILVLYENFAADYETSTLNLLERLDLSPPDDFELPAADEETVRQRQRRLDEALLRAAPGHRVRPRPGQSRQAVTRFQNLL